MTTVGVLALVARAKLNSPTARRWLRRGAASLFVAVTCGVVLSHQFPALTNGPRTSAELLAAVFRAPVEIPANAASYALGRMKKEAVIAFIQVLDAPADVKARAVSLLTSTRFDTVTGPFLFYLYDLYGASAQATPEATADLGYGEVTTTSPASSPNLSTTMLRHPLVVRRHAGHALRLFDALFLRVKPGATDSMPVADRYDRAAYRDIAAVVRGMAADFMGAPDAAGRSEKSEYVVMLEETLRDDARLAVFVEFFTDLIRDLTDRWLQGFVAREARKSARISWVNERLGENRFFDVADFARARAERRLAVHLAVDGLQGKLLEGLVQLSNGDRANAGARYVMDLVREHQSGGSTEAPAAGLPPPLGRDVVELAERAPMKPDYLEYFKRHFFSANSPAVVVDVATVDTPSISVRNLPIIYSGHGVSGPSGTGIPNFSYLDRATERGWYFWGSDVLHMRDIVANREDRVPESRRREGPGARTLMERLWQLNTVSAMATVDTGALETVSSEVGIGIGELSRNFIEKALVLKFRQRADMERQLNERRRWLVEHRRTSASVLASLVTAPLTVATFREHALFLAEHDDEGLPDYLLWYNPWPDHFAHAEGPYSDAIIGYTGEYDRLDFYLGKMMDVYASVPSAFDVGTSYADRALVGIVSDHGLVYTPRLVSTDAVLFDAMRRDGLDVKTLKLTHDEGGLPAIHARNAVKPTRPYDVVVGSTAGGSYIMDLFLTTAPTGEAERWRTHPDYHQLRNLPLLSGRPVDWVDQIVRRLGDTMDFAVMRESGPRPGASWTAAVSADGTNWRVESVVRVVTASRGDARIYRLRSGTGPTLGARYRYEVLGSEDPLDLEGSVRDFLLPTGRQIADARMAIRDAVASPEGLDDRTWRDLLASTVRPDVVFQLSHLYDSDRAGTVNIFPSATVGMNSSVPGRHAGESFGEKNGTQLYRGAGLTQSTIHTARNGSLPVTLYHWLVGDAAFGDPARPESPAEQFGYPTLLREPAFAGISR